jgi:hypothetical protein
MFQQTGLQFLMKQATILVMFFHESVLFFQQLWAIFTTLNTGISRL